MSFPRGTTQHLLVSLALAAIASAGCFEPEAGTDAALVQALEKTASPHPNPSLAPISFSGTISGTTDYYYDRIVGVPIVHDFELPPGAAAMTVDLRWTTGGQDVTGTDLNFYVGAGDQSEISGAGHCTNFLPAPDPLAYWGCNRDRSEQAVIEGLNAADVGSWELVVSARQAANADYVATITFAPA